MPLTTLCHRKLVNEGNLRRPEIEVRRRRSKRRMRVILMPTLASSVAF